jgi:hypothetical protein
LDGVADRTVRLLFALLLQPAHRTDFENGYGLCVRHAARAIVGAPNRRLARVVAAATLARLAVLQWALDEVLRTQAWTARAERNDADGRVWRTAMHRFTAGLA